MPAPLKIMIHNVCKTTPQRGFLDKLGMKHPNKVQWRAEKEEDVYLLELPGNVFVGHSQPFTLTIAGKANQPLIPLLLVENQPDRVISRYISTSNGVFCLILDQPPPEIVIES